MQDVLAYIYSTTALENYRFSTQGVVDNRSTIYIGTYAL